MSQVTKRLNYTEYVMKKKRYNTVTTFIIIAR